MRSIIRARSPTCSGIYDSVVLFTTDGRILSTADFLEIDDVFSFRRKGSFTDIKALSPEVVVLFNNVLWAWTGNLEEFDPPLPSSDEYYINVWGTRASAFAFAPSQIFQLQERGWIHINYTLE